MVGIVVDLGIVYMRYTNSIWSQNLLLMLSLLLSGSLLAHGVDENARDFLSQNQGVSIIPFMYIGAKHMITGYDHLLFLVGVIFFLYRTKDILIYVTLFTVGHSITLLFGVLNNIEFNPYLIDAVIAFSIVYKGFENLGGFKRLFGYTPNLKAAVMVFGLCHGFGLATKIQEFDLPVQGLVPNIIAFNVGVELGQFCALALVLIVISFWRQFRCYLKFSLIVNTALMGAGLTLLGYQLSGYFIGLN